MIWFSPSVRYVSHDQQLPHQARWRMRGVCCTEHHVWLPCRQIRHTAVMARVWIIDAQLMFLLLFEMLVGDEEMRRRATACIVLMLLIRFPVLWSFWVGSGPWLAACVWVTMLHLLSCVIAYCSTLHSSNAFLFSIFQRTLWLLFAFVFLLFLKHWNLVFETNQIKPNPQLAVKRIRFSTHVRSNQLLQQQRV